MASSGEIGVHVFDSPTRIVYGPGSSQTIGREAATLGAKRCFIVTDPGIAEVGIAGRVEESVKAVGLAVAVHAGAVPNPDVESVDAAAAAAREFGADLIIGVGGGSSLDTAKLVGVLLSHDKPSIYDFFKSPVVSNPIVPVFGVPTTAGTGSEVSYFAIVNKKQVGERLSLASPLIFCSVAILEPEFAAYMPPKIAAATGLDALAHALEGYTTRRATLFSDALAAEAIRLVGGNLVRLVEEPGNIDAANKMLMASCLAGIVLNYSAVGLAHALARPLSTFYGVHHGLANAITLPSYIAFNLPGHEEVFARVAQLLGAKGDRSEKELAQTAVDIVLEMGRRTGIPDNLTVLGVPRADIGRMTDAMMAFPSSLVSNLNPVSREDIESIFGSLLP